MGFNEASGVVLLDWLRVVKMELARGGVCRSVVLPVCPAWSVVRRRGRREEGSEEDLNALQETRKKCAGLPLASPDVLLACLVCVDLGEGGEGEGMHGLDRAERSMLANAASRPGFSETHRSSEVARLPPLPSPSPIQQTTQPQDHLISCIVCPRPRTPTQNCQCHRANKNLTSPSALHHPSLTRTKQHEASKQAKSNMRGTLTSTARVS